MSDIGDTTEVVIPDPGDALSLGIRLDRDLIEGMELNRLADARANQAENQVALSAL
jgi:hypothetical protein